MKTIEDILNRCYLIVNVSAVTSLLDGRIHRHKKPLNDKLKNIVLTALLIKPATSFERGTLTQTGVVHINCYAQNLSNGKPDETSINAIMAAVIPKIEAGHGTTEFFELDIVGQQIFQDPDEDDMSYGSIRVNYRIGS